MSERSDSAQTGEEQRAVQAGSPYVAYVAGGYEFSGERNRWVSATKPSSDKSLATYYPILRRNLPQDIAKLARGGEERVLQFVTDRGLLGYSAVMLAGVEGLQGKANAARRVFSAAELKISNPLRDLKERLGDEPGTIGGYVARGLANRPKVERLAERLGGRGKGLARSIDNLPRSVWEAREGEPAQRGDPLPWIAAHARGINLIVDWLGQQGTYGEPYLEDFRGPEEGEGQTIEVGDTTGARTMELAPDADEQAIEAELLLVIDRNLVGVSPRSGSRPSGQYFPQFHFSALVQFAYWHLLNQWNSGQELGKCDDPRCGAWFVRTDERQRFCPAEPNQRDSRCASRVRQRNRAKEG